MRIGMAAVLASTVMLAGIATDSGAARGTFTDTSQLRIEGPKGNLDPGTWYVTGDERIKRSRGNSCKHRQGRISVPGSTALGIAETAARTDGDLPPVRVRPDDFGLFVCEMGGLIGRPFDDPDGFSGWTYWVNNVSGAQSAENETLEGGDEVLWLFADFGSHPVNSGDVLELTGVPAYDADGTFQVQVQSHSFDGTPSAAAGTKIKGAESFEDNDNGTYDVTVGDGFTTLFAKDRPNVPSNQVEVCVDPSPSDCPSAHGRTVVGSANDDILEDTGGWDSFRTLGGDDKVDIVQGGRDRVDCGGGDDTVYRLDADTDDEIEGSCEHVVDLS